MAVEYNTTVVTSGLLANWDFANPKSFNPVQNLLRQSDEFNNSPWTKSNTTITSNATVSPDGTLSGDKLIADTVNAAHSCQQGFSVTTGASYTFSFYAKAGEYAYVGLLLATAGFGTNSVDRFDLVNGTVIANVSGTASITSVGNGWYRCSATRTATATASSAFQIRVFEISSGAAYPGNNTSGIFIWGAQLERNSFLNDYISTTSLVLDRSTNIIDTIGGYNMSNSYGNNAIYINTTNSFMQFTRATAVPKDGGGATVGTSGALTVTNFLYNDHTWEIWFRIDDRTPGNTIWTADANEGASALSVYQGYHAGFTYSSTVMFYIIWNGVASAPTCASWTVGANGAQINQDSWYQMVVTRSGNVFTPYINGVPLGTGSTTVTSATGISTSNNLWLGKTANVAAGAGAFLNYSRNSVANMKMYNRALSAEEINSNFQALRGRFGI
jgi:hypothetical protein